MFAQRRSQWNRFKALNAFARVSVNVELGAQLRAAICEEQTHNTIAILTAGKQRQMLLNSLAISFYKLLHTGGHSCQRRCVITATQFKEDDVFWFIFYLMKIKSDFPWRSRVLLVWADTWCTTRSTCCGSAGDTDTWKGWGRRWGTRSPWWGTANCKQASIHLVCSV